MSSDDLGRDLKAIGIRTWDVFVRDPLTFVLAFVVLLVVGTVTLWITVPALTVGYIKMIKKAAAGETIAIGEIFDGFSNFASALITGLIMGVGVSLGMVLAVLPGLLVLAVTFFALHFVAYENASVEQSLTGSLALFKKNPLLVAIVVLAAVILGALGSSIAVGVLLTGPLAIIAATMTFELLRQDTPALDTTN